MPDSQPPQQVGALPAVDDRVHSKPKERELQNQSNEMSTHMTDGSTTTIMEFSEDISSAEAPDPLPIGEYPGEIRAAEIKESQRGNHYAAVQLYIAPEAFPADYEIDNNPDGLILGYNRVMLEDNPRARYRLRKFCEAIGVPPPGKSVDVASWIGQEITISLAHGEWEGMVREEAAKISEAR